MVSTPLSFVAVAQMVEHQISTLRVASSILVSDSKLVISSSFELDLSTKLDSI